MVSKVDSVCDSLLFDHILITTDQLNKSTNFSPIKLNKNLFSINFLSGGIPQTTLFKKDVVYSNRHEVIRGLPGGQELTLCLLAETSTGRVRSWKQDQCKKVGPFSNSNFISSTKALLVSCLIVAFHFF
jgi:hypothetical protein